jgi:hypothetical protein
VLPRFAATDILEPDLRIQFRGSTETQMPPGLVSVKKGRTIAAMV